MGIRGILLFAITVTALMRKGMCPLTGRGRPGLQRMLFDAAGRKLAKNQRGGKGAARKLKPEEVDFWLTGHIHCGECGAPLHGISGTSKTRNVYYYYTCLNRKKKSMQNE